MKFKLLKLLKRLVLFIGVLNAIFTIIGWFFIALSPLQLIKIFVILFCITIAAIFMGLIGFLLPVLPFAMLDDIGVIEVDGIHMLYLMIFSFAWLGSTYMLRRYEKIIDYMLIASVVSWIFYLLLISYKNVFSGFLGDGIYDLFIMGVVLGGVFFASYIYSVVEDLLIRD